MISRLPNMRASSENAPGPRNASDAATMTIFRIENRLPTLLAEGGGSNEIIRARPPRITITLTTGVIKPVNSDTPAVVVKVPTTALLKSTFGHP